MGSELIKAFFQLEEIRKELEEEQKEINRMNAFLLQQLEELKKIIEKHKEQ